MRGGAGGRERGTRAGLPRRPAARLAAAAALALLLAAGSAQASSTTVTLSDLSPATGQRWLDCAGNPYAPAFQAGYRYAAAQVSATYADRGETFAVTLEAAGLKPNFAYQVKLVGNRADERAFEAIGYAGRWWLSIGGTNFTDTQYEAWKNDPGVAIASYILLGYFVTDGAGNARQDFVLDSTWHVLWSRELNGRSPGPGDSAVFAHAFAPDGAAYATPSAAPATQHLWLEHEWVNPRPPAGGVRLPAGAYLAEVQLTEESFHQGGAGGNWATVLGAPVRFAVNAAPVAVAAVAGPANPGANEPVAFSAAGSSDADGSIAGYSWDFGDGAPAGSGAAPVHAFARGGTYTVTLTVTDDEGARGTATLAVAIRWRYSLGVFCGGRFNLDENRNGRWDGLPLDRRLIFGLAGDLPLAGDWNGDGQEEIGVFRGGRFFLDANANGRWDGFALDRGFVFGLAGDLPLAGDWNGDGRDEIGVFRGGRFFLDANGNGRWDGFALDRGFVFGLAGDLPLAGDWNGDGQDEIGTFRAGRWRLDADGDGAWSALDARFAFGLAGDRPVARAP